MPSDPTLYTRGIIPGLPPTIPVVHLDHRSCLALQLTINLAADDHQLLGISLRLSKNGRVNAVALATPTKAFLVSLGKDATPSSAASSCGITIARILENPRCLVAGLNVARTALLLHRQTGAHVYGVELTSLPVNRDHGPPGPASAASLAYTFLDSHRQRDIHALWLREGNFDLCLKAWILANIAERTAATLATYAKVNTRNLHAHQLSCLSQLVLNIELVEADKPTKVENDFDKIELGEDGHLVLRNARFKTRVRRSAKTVIEINGGKVKAQALSHKGKSTTLAVYQGRFKPGKVRNVRVVGREEATCAEEVRDAFLLCVLQGVTKLDASPYVRTLWFPSGNVQKGKKRGVPTGIPCCEGLNDAQKRVAVAMMAEDEPLVIAHGPPGTGKTSTIAAVLAHWQTRREPAWVIAHSNVGVQNIAISMFNRGIDFRLIVSHDFHFEWHEHLYADIEDRLIRSDHFGHAFDAKNHIGHTSVMLCTLSMLSSPGLDSHGFFRHVPMERLIVDEASQIDTFEFMHVFDKFCKETSQTQNQRHPKKTLSKVCMFGDPKQLPPFGSEVARKIKTIFDFKHLKASAYFLDTQYRMPVPLGNFVSQNVYDSKLKSVHAIQDSKCVLFIDVRKGKEESVGSSWKNTEEVNTIVNIVKKYYHHKEYCVITAYDAQRGAITAALKTAGVPRHEHVYNVDSFQGHEAPYIIVSAVRTSGAGFMKSLNRMNVMLTRCQAGMVIVTQRAFLHNASTGKKTLLGTLAEHWEKRVGPTLAWADAMEVADGRASLPGAPATKVTGTVSGLTARMAALSVTR